MSKTITIREIADLVSGELRGPGDQPIAGVASLEFARATDLSFLGNPQFKEAAQNSKAGAIIVSEPLKLNTPQVIVKDPYLAFVKVMEFFHPRISPVPGIHASAVLEPDVQLGAGVSVGAHAVIGQGAKIGARSALGAGCVIGAGCELGADCALQPRVTLYPGSRLGNRVVIHSGAVIGADGFGYILSESGHMKKPQVGRVIIEDDVEIGANCTIDRAMLDATVLGAGTKLDNLVHLAHGVRVGKHCIILAGVAIGGSTRIGDHCIISGNSTLKDNITIGDRVTVAGHSAVTDDVLAGQVVWGFPAMPFSLAKRVFARVKQLPDLFKRVRALEKALGTRKQKSPRP